MEKFPFGGFANWKRPSSGNPNQNQKRRKTTVVECGEPKYVDHVTPLTFSALHKGVTKGKEEGKEEGREEKEEEDVEKEEGQEEGGEEDEDEDEDEDEEEEGEEEEEEEDNKDEDEVRVKEEEGDDDDNDDDVEEEGKEEDEEVKDGSTTDRSIYVTISDPSVFDCCICSESLTFPVYQCVNGHFTCSSCIWRKCTVCEMPIAFNLCKGMENVLNSIKISCQHANYGCKETLNYNEKNEHKKNCIYVPCFCPLSGCDFVASSKELSMHFSNKHSASRIQFSYNHSFSISLDSNDKAIILQEQTDGKLFILNNNVMSLGNVISVTCIGPNSSQPSYRYDLLAKSQGCSLKLESFTKNVRRLTFDTPSSGFLVVPSDYFGSSKVLNLIVCISYT